jgi:hypothetical protein
MLHARDVYRPDNRDEMLHNTSLCPCVRVSVCPCVPVWPTGCRLRPSEEGDKSSSLNDSEPYAIIINELDFEECCLLGCYAVRSCKNRRFGGT